MKNFTFTYYYLQTLLYGYINKIHIRIFHKNKKLIRLKPKKTELLSAEAGNLWLKTKLLSGKPFAAVRMGGCEMAAINGFLAQKNRIGILTQKRRNQLIECAGFFPDDIYMINKYCELNLELSRHCDMFAMFNVINLSYIYDYFVYPNGGIAAESDSLQPYFFADPWSAALAGKKVLVIHPFSDTIQSQYHKNRELLFRNKKVLPEFELKCLKAVQTIAHTQDDRFANWFEALDWMTEQALKIDFDVAIIGCGAYGYPLAIRLKQAGKQAIHMGGATQLLFGIIGKRWETERIAAEFNDYWTRPGTANSIANQSRVENGCYW